MPLFFLTITNATKCKYRKWTGIINHSLHFDTTTDYCQKPDKSWVEYPGQWIISIKPHQAQCRQLKDLFFISGHVWYISLILFLLQHPQLIILWIKCVCFFRGSKIMKYRNRPVWKYISCKNKIIFWMWLQELHAQWTLLTYIEQDQISYCGQEDECKEIKMLDRTLDPSGT